MNCLSLPDGNSRTDPITIYKATNTKKNVILEGKNIPKCVIFDFFKTDCPAKLTDCYVFDSFIIVTCISSFLRHFYLNHEYVMIVIIKYM